MVFGVLVVLTALATAATLRWYAADQRRRREAVGAGPDDDARCASCGSTSLVVAGPGLYRCATCGYAGGSAAGAAFEQDQRVLASRLTEAAQRALAEPHLRAAGVAWQRARDELASGGGLEGLADRLSAGQAAILAALGVWDGAEAVLDAAGVDPRAPLPAGSEATPVAALAWVERQLHGLDALTVRSDGDAPAGATEGT